jgi:hypothetical protein
MLTTDPMSLTAEESACGEMDFTALIRRSIGSSVALGFPDVLVKGFELFPSGLVNS